MVDILRRNKTNVFSFLVLIFSANMTASQSHLPVLVELGVDPRTRSQKPLAAFGAPRLGGEVQGGEAVLRRGSVVCPAAGRGNRVGHIGWIRSVDSLALTCLRCHVVELGAICRDGIVSRLF